MANAACLFSSQLSSKFEPFHAHYSLLHSGSVLTQVTFLVLGYVNFPNSDYMYLQISPTTLITPRVVMFPYLLPPPAMPENRVLHRLLSLPRSNWIHDGVEWRLSFLKIFLSRSNQNVGGGVCKSRYFPRDLVSSGGQGFLNLHSFNW